MEILREILSLLNKNLVIGFIIIFIISICLAIKEDKHSRLYRNPFSYPYLIVTIDVSGRRLPELTNILDEWLIYDKLAHVQEAETILQKWKTQCEANIDACQTERERKIRMNQYQSILDDSHLIQIVMSRGLKVPITYNYMSESITKPLTYEPGIKKATNPMEQPIPAGYSATELRKRYESLAAIGFECSLTEFEQKKQRRLMTPELRRQIAKRDNYTCQICGKYMPDLIGLQIDHIVPIAKGGKSVPDNLQVLCSRCNGQKSDKI